MKTILFIEAVDTLSPLFEGVTLLKLFASAFLAITFLQPGFDKVVNFRANRAYFDEHFKNSPLASTIGVFFPVIIGLELVAGGLAVASIGQLLLTGQDSLGLLGTVVSAVTMLSLYFGQRMAKDYPGASGLVPYFLLILASQTLFLTA